MAPLIDEGGFIPTVDHTVSPDVSLENFRITESREHRIEEGKYMDWKAKWIWDGGEAQARNYWLCFRKSIDIDDSLEGAVLHITADSRYAVYINGIHTGMGPVRSWPHELFYDTYDIKEQLHRGRNVVAVLVTHYGVSNYQYIEGRGGLFARLELSATSAGTVSGTEDGGSSSRSFVTGTDSSWKTHIHPGYCRNSMRISMAMAWAEIFDAAAFDDAWTGMDYDDGQWEPAVEIGEYGMDPWKRLQQRDIPFLREEPVYPARIDSFKEVIPEGNPVSLDLQPNLFPDNTKSVMPVISGYVATIIHSPRNLSGRLYFPWNLWASPFGSFRINDRIYSINPYLAT